MTNNLSCDDGNGASKVRYLDILSTMPREEPGICSI